MTNEDGTVAIVVNGEIYNHAELRARSRGARATASAARSDTEVVAHLYEEVGDARRPSSCAACSRFAVWDRARRGRCCSRAIASARSRCTTATAPDGFVFASELGALVADPRTPTRAVADGARRVPGAAIRARAAHDLRRASSKLPAAHMLSVRCGRRARCVRRYYAHVVRADARRHRRGGGGAARARHRRGGRARRGSCPTCRSARSCPAASIRRSSSRAWRARPARRVKTFSVGFAEGDRIDNELPYARLVAERYRTDHHELVVDPDMVRPACPASSGITASRSPTRRRSRPATCVR